MPNEERGLGGRASERRLRAWLGACGCSRLLSRLWDPLLGFPKVWLLPGGAGTVLASPPGCPPMAGGVCRALPVQRCPLKCWERPEQPGSLLMINAKSGIEQWWNTVNINYYFNTQPASAPRSRQFHKFRYQVNARLCGLVSQSVLCSKWR